VRLQLQGGSRRTPGPEARLGDRLGFLQRMWPPVRGGSMRLPQKCTGCRAADPEELPKRMAK